MRRKLALLALVGVLAGVTGCQGTADWLKANYAVKQGNVFYKAGNYLKAIEWYRYATYLNPDLTVAYQNTAFAFMGEYKPGSKHPKDLRYSQGAIDNLKRYLSYYPDDRDAENYLLTIYLQAERYDEAAAYFEEQLKKRGNDPAAASELMLRIGMIYAKKGDFDSSLEWYKRRAEIEKDNPEALYTIGVLCWDKVYHAPLTIDLNRRTELIEMGLDYLKRAADQRENYFEAVLYINLLYREKAKLAQQTGNLDEATKWIQEADKQQKLALEMRKKVMAKK
jgi:tetratricopeptide (TPR) repeat protein